MAGSVHIRNRNGRLYIEVYVNGKQSRRSLGLTLTGDRAQDKKVMALARIIRSRREMQIACAEWGIPDMTASDKPLHSYIDENYCKTKNPTLGRCLHYVRKFGGGDVALARLTPAWVADFQEWLLTESGLSQGSASLYSSALRHQLRLAVRDGLIASSPADSVRNIPMPESKKRPLTMAQLRTLAAIPIPGRLGAEVKKAFIFACFTGLRVSDLRTLRKDMLRERADGTVWLCKRQKKTGAGVSIPLHRDALAMAGGLGSDSHVFPLLSATKSNTDQYLRKWGLRAGIDHVSWHTARHTMATVALEHGAELRTVSGLLGHTNISTTLRYAMATDPLKVSAIGAIPRL